MGVSRRRPLSAACVLAMLCAACGTAGSTPANPEANASGAKVEPLASGSLPALPTGNLFIRVVEFRQTVSTSFPSTKHVPGLIFQDAGSQVLAIENGETVNIGPAQGYFLGPLAHTHSNPGPTENHWYFIALWPTSARSSPLVSLSARVAAETPDFPLTAFLPGSYSETLRRVTLQLGGRSFAARYGGAEELFVLEGSINLHVAGMPPETLATDQGTFVVPGKATQVFNQASGPSEFLAFFVTAAQQPFETPVEQSP